MTSAGPYASLHLRRLSSLYRIYNSGQTRSVIISSLIYIQTGFTFLVPAYPGCPGKEAVKWVQWVSRSVRDATTETYGWARSVEYTAECRWVLRRCRRTRVRRRSWVRRTPRSRTWTASITTAWRQVSGSGRWTTCRAGRRPSLHWLCSLPFTGTDQWHAASMNVLGTLTVGFLQCFDAVGWAAGRASGL